MATYQINGNVSDDNGDSLYIADFVIEADDKDEALERFVQRVAENIEATGGYITSASVDVSFRYTGSVTVDLDFDESDELEDEDDVISFLENEPAVLYEAITDQLDLNSWSVDYDVDNVSTNLDD